MLGSHGLSACARAGHGERNHDCLTSCRMGPLDSLSQMAGNWVVPNAEKLFFNKTQQNETEPWLSRIPSPSSVSACECEQPGKSASLSACVRFLVEPCRPALCIHCLGVAGLPTNCRPSWAAHGEWEQIALHTVRRWTAWVPVAAVAEYALFPMHFPAAGPCAAHTRQSREAKGGGLVSGVSSWWNCKMLRGTEVAHSSARCGSFLPWSERERCQKFVLELRGDGREMHERWAGYTLKFVTRRHVAECNPPYTPYMSYTLYLLLCCV